MTQNTAERVEVSLPTVAKRTVKKLSRTEPVHAKDLEGLIGLHMNIRQGEPCDHMRLDFELSCGASLLHVSGHEYELSLRMCHVTLARENCFILPGTTYEFRLGDGSIAVSGVEKHATGHSGEIGANADLGVEATATGVGFKALFGAKAHKGSKRDESKEAVTTKSTRIGLVVTAGQDRWQVGDPQFGDGRRPDGKLSGNYFVENVDADGSASPLCAVCWADESEPVSLTVSATVPLSQLLIYRERNPAGPEARRQAESRIKRRSSRASAEHSKREEVLRAKIAGMVAAKAIARAQRKKGLELKEGEFLVARQLLAVPVVD